MLWVASRGLARAVERQNKVVMLAVMREVQMCYACAGRSFTSMVLMQGPALLDAASHQGCGRLLFWGTGLLLSLQQARHAAQRGKRPAGQEVFHVPAQRASAEACSTAKHSMRATPV